MQNKKVLTIKKTYLRGVFGKNSFMKKIALFLFLCCALTSLARQANPKREFRGAWIQAVNGQFRGMSKQTMQDNLTKQLNALQSCGINVIMFQVRVEGDALYQSSLEPWSRYLTGRQGTAPSPYWDPLAWMVEECHKRGMELHAWINPFRAKTKGTSALATTHRCIENPDCFFDYDGLYIFDPGKPENREYICRVAADIVRRYDVDGFHIDDYFYPYPVAGLEIPDGRTFSAYSEGIADVGDWRRNNVSTFVDMLQDSIKAVKPWVKFGISPFGIYHNEKAGDRVPGSKTNGLQNYDDLYADILLWIDKGWVDYTVPQIYWEIGHKAADYETLTKWWARYASKRPLVIGQDIERTVRAADLKNPSQNQMEAKYALQRGEEGIVGSCQWYSAALVRNEGGYADKLRAGYHAAPALQPLFPFMDDEAPKKVSKLKALWMPDGYYLFWTAPKSKNPNSKKYKLKDRMNEVWQYVVYRFEKNEKINLEDPSHIVAVTSQTMLKLPYYKGRTQYIYVVTALDRLHNESKAVKKKIKL